MERTLRRLMVSMPLLTSVGAQAMSIGEIDVTSHLGEPLRARVPISLDGEYLAHEQCARLVGPARHHPDLAEARVSIAGQAGRYVIVIDTDTPVGDPVLDLTLLMEGCGPTMRKDFVLLLSPKAIEATAVPVARPVPPRVTQDPAVKPPPWPAPRAAKAKTIAKRVPRPARIPAPGRPTARYSLRLDYDHLAFGQLAERIAERRQAAYRAAANKPETRPTDAKSATNAQATKPQPGGPAARPTLPAAKPVPNDRLILQPAPDDLRPQAPDAAETTTTGASDGATLPGSVPTPAPTNAPARAAGQAGKSLAGAPPKTDARPWYDWLRENYSLALPLLLILVAAAVALWLKLRRPQSRFLDKTAPDLQSLFPADMDDSMPSPLMPDNLPPADEVFIEPAQAQALLNDTLEPRPRPRNIEALEFATDIGHRPIKDEAFSVEQHESFDHVMELAEVMLAFGRSGQAIDALSHHIRDNPRQSLDPWLKLLDLYHQSNLRPEFEALAENLHRYYNVAVIDWDDYAASSAATPPDGPLTLESLPHVMNRLIECWGTQAGLDYVDKVLADNRDGQRLGFSMPIVRDILLLRDILRQICAVPAVSQ